MEYIVIPIVILGVLLVTALYSCLVVASRESRKEEEYLGRKHKK